MTDTIQFWGYAHLAGQTVSAFVGGLDAGDYTVATDGSVTVDMESDPDGLLTYDYLATLDASTWGEQAAAVTLNNFDSPQTITVPVVIGLPYTSRGQCVRPATAEDLKSQTGPSLGKLRRGQQMAMLLENTGPFYYGTTTANVVPAKLTQADRNTALASSDSFTGVFQETLPDTHGYDTMLLWEITRPVPFIVCSVTTFLHGAEK